MTFQVFHDLYEPCFTHLLLHNDQQTMATFYFYFKFRLIALILTLRLSGSSVLPAYPGFIVINTAHEGLSASSTPSNMKRSA